MRNIRRHGFTLVEMLVVIIIIAILMGIVGAIIVEVINRAKYTKTVGLIQVLNQGCERYRNEDPSRKYPGPGNNAADSTKALHFYLGSERNVVKQVGMEPVKESPIVFFKREFLLGPPPNSDPGTSVANSVPIVDGWKVEMRYNTADNNLWETKTGSSVGPDESIAIQSAGADGVFDTGGGVDDAGNWETVGTVN